MGTAWPNHIIASLTVNKHHSGMVRNIVSYSSFFWSILFWTETANPGNVTVFSRNQGIPRESRKDQPQVVKQSIRHNRPAGWLPIWEIRWWQTTDRVGVSARIDSARDWLARQWWEWKAVIHAFGHCSITRMRLLWQDYSGSFQKDIQGRVYCVVCAEYDMQCVFSMLYRQRILSMLCRYVLYNT